VPGLPVDGGDSQLLADFGARMLMDFSQRRKYLKRLHRLGNHDWVIRSQLRSMTGSDLHWAQNMATCRRCGFKIALCSLHMIGEDALGLHPADEYIPRNCAEKLIQDVYEA
jgi:hypothetical protein